MSETVAESGLTPALRAEIQDAYRAWLASRGFGPRRGQRLMIAEIARTLAEIPRDVEGRRSPEVEAPHVCVVEAGTGTGKTVAYGLGAVPVALSQGLGLVIATATVALQDQLVTRDLPDLLASTPLRFTFALAKGRGRYVCPARLDRHVSEDTGAGLPRDLFEVEGLDAGPSPAAARAVYRDMLDDLTSGTWDGDRERWHRAVDDRTWAAATMDHRGCTGGRCTFFRDCPYFLARERVQKADVVVANHDLVLSDLALGGGVVLPAPADTLYVFDEGHHLADKALGHLRRFTRALGGIQNVEAVEKLLGTLAQRGGRDEALVRCAQRAAATSEPLRSGLRHALDLVEGLPGLQTPSGRRGGRPVHRFPLGEIPTELREQAASLAAGHEELVDALVEAEDRLRRLLDGAGPRDEMEVWLTGLGQYQARMEGAASLWADYARADDRIEARWVARTGEEGGLDVEFQSSPLDASDSLAEVLWSRCHGAVVSSATLATTDGFRRFADAVGVPATARYLQVPSSFPYEDAAELVVPAMATDPGDAGAHTDELARLLPELVASDEATLVIFTSWRQLQTVTEVIPPELARRVLSQADLPKAQILGRHRQRVEAGEGSVIFGLASFAEGIDLPGDYCRHVIVTKLPFAVPDDPVEAAVAEWLESEGRNPFLEVSVPDAALKLKQACGRLLRSETDSGRITVLDRRLVTRRYGKAILGVLPPFRRRIEPPRPAPRRASG